MFHSLNQLHNNKTKRRSKCQPDAKKSSHYWWGHLFLIVAHRSGIVDSKFALIYEMAKYVCRFILTLVPKSLQDLPNNRWKMRRNTSTVWIRSRNGWKRVCGGVDLCCISIAPAGMPSVALKVRLPSVVYHAAAIEKKTKKFTQPIFTKFTQFSDNFIYPFS